MFAKSLTTSASVKPMNRVSMFSLIAPCWRRAAKVCAFSAESLSQDTMIRRTAASHFHCQPPKPAVAESLMWPIVKAARNPEMTRFVLNFIFIPRFLKPLKFVVLSGKPDK